MEVVDVLRCRLLPIIAYGCNTQLLELRLQTHKVLQTSSNSLMVQHSSRRISEGEKKDNSLKSGLSY